MTNQKTITIIDMISWLRAKLKKDGYRVYDRYDEEPGLPIHLCCTKSEGKTKESLIVIVSSATEIAKNYFKKLCFFQSYLSLYDNMGPDELKLILAIPDNAKIIEEPLSSKPGPEQVVRQESYKERGFGLLKIKAPTNSELAKFEYIYQPITLRERMKEDIREKSFSEKKEEIKAMARFFNKYIDEAVFGIAGANPVKFEERNIDRKLLEHINSLESVSYATELQQIANDYLSYEKDDYSFAMEWTKTLWEKYFNLSYPNIHEKLEPLLKELYPKYRDHFLHQFQVFLLGSIMIDYLIASERINCNKHTLSKGWLLAATFHDFAQAVQKYEDWNKIFFKESLKIEIPEALELKKYYFENTFLSSAEHIISSLEKCFCDFEEQDRTENYNKIRHFFYHQITEKKNHGLLSSLSLLKRFEANDEFHTVILPSATAIAIHDDAIWQALSGALGNYDKDEWITNLCTLKPLSRLKLNTQPLSFLLILNDNIQDWGRHFKDLGLEKSLKSANIELKSISLNDDRITIQLFVNVNVNSLDYIKYKIDKLNLIKTFLQSSSPHFMIELWDKEKNEKTSFNVEIGD